MRAQASDDVDVIITEIGGTVGDIESQPFLEAAREVRRDLGPDNCMFVHVSLVPYISAAHELKTKPTQHSVMMLRQLGISPDALVLRSDRPLNQSIKDKISLMCDVDAEGVVNCVDAPSIYDVPKILFEEGLDAYVVRELGLPFHDVDWDEWADLLERVHHPKHEVNIAIVGKYIDLPDAYLSVTEAIKAGGFANWAKVNVKWVAADRCETTEGAAAALDNVDGIVIPGGFGIRGIDGKIGALKFARETKLPALGLCLGLQSMVIEYSRHVLGIEDANSSEFEPDCANPVIATMEEQKDIVAGKGDACHRASPPPLRSQRGLQGSSARRRPAHLRPEPGRRAHRVRGTAAGRAPVLCGHPGSPGVQVSPDQAAPAVRRPGQGRARPSGGALTHFRAVHNIAA